MKYAKPLEWSVGTSYKRGDIVKYKNIYYTCAADHTSTIAGPPDTDIYEGEWIKAGSNYNVYPSVSEIMPFVIGATRLAVNWWENFETWYTNEIGGTTEAIVYKINKYENNRTSSGYDYTINDIGIMAFVLSRMYSSKVGIK